MPIRNMGTLLENVALLSAARVALEIAPRTAPIAFASAFAMPPVSAWKPHGTDYHFTERMLADVQLDGAFSESSSYRAILGDVLRAHGGLGPSGALLVGMLAQRQAKPFRMWLNDSGSEEFYPGTLDGLRDFARFFPGDKEHAPLKSEVAVCSAPYPESLVNLSQWLESVHGPDLGPRARLGFLDPLKYTASSRGPAETSSPDHRQWLRTLREGDPTYAFSVHFSGNRDSASRAVEMRSMEEDSSAEGYSFIERGHANYSSTISVYARDGRDEAASLARRVAEGLTNEWEAWAQSVAKLPSALR